ncbi:sensor histidine kinase [Pedobacter sp. G11]|uniref:sensor histidine kinase n=1 Tax=Pedobacter sp. G11 TaxID=2482728 RepID=UPI001AEFD003|nr:histidine kinase [Pedobacter sp. G11]
MEVIVTRGINGYFSTKEYYISFYALNITLFYFHAFVTMKPFSRQRPRTFLFLLLFILELSVYFLTSLILGGVLNYHNGRGFILPELSIKFIFGTIWRSVIFIMVSTGYYFHVQFLLKQKKESEQEIAMEKLQNELLTSQQNYLRAQVNPHILFNTLNFIRHASKKDPKLAEEAILIFSEIMSYALSGDQKELSSLKRETAQIQNIIKLNRLRFGTNLNLEYTEQIHFDHYLPPIILLTIVENIFKHGNFQEPSIPAIIKIYADEDVLVLKTSNSIMNKNDTGGTHIGLKNILARLDKTYGQWFEFRYGPVGNIFTTELTINFLQSNKNLQT